MQCPPEAAAKLTMYTNEQNSRYPEKTRAKLPKFIKSGTKCPMRIVGDNHKDMNDTMIMFEGRECLLPGDTCDEVYMAFLCPDLVLPKITIGTKFKLWSGEFFAQGEFTHIYQVSPTS